MLLPPGSPGGPWGGSPPGVAAGEVRGGGNPPENGNTKRSPDGSDAKEALKTLQESGGNRRRSAQLDLEARPNQAPQYAKRCANKPTQNDAERFSLGF